MMEDGGPMRSPCRVRAKEEQLRQVLASRAILGRRGAIAIAIWALLSATALVPHAAAQGEGAEPVAASAAGEEQAKPAPSAPDAGDQPAPAAITPPDGEWLVDENGLRYYLQEFERLPHYKILPDGRVMLPPGASYELFEAREDVLVVKIYDPTSFPFTPREEPKPLSERVADLRKLEMATVDRLTFSRLEGDLPDRGQWRQSFDLVDIDGDGNLDIVHGPPRKTGGTPMIFLGDGRGGWRRWREARFQGRPLDYGDVAVADFNADGTLDIAFAVHLRGLLVMVGDGKGNFKEWGEGLPYWVPGQGTEVPPFSSRTVVALDWNRDGLPDLLALGEGPRIMRDARSTAPSVNVGERGAAIFLNKGDGRWERYDQGSGREKIFADDLALGDFDGDGVVDFALASRVSGATKLVKMGREDGSWEDVALPGEVRPGTYSSIHAADLDGDGRDEILLGYMISDAGTGWWTGIDLLEYEGGSWKSAPIAAEHADLQGVTALTSGDLDGDGRLDVVALTGNGERWVLLATDRPGVYVREESPELAANDPGCRGYSAGIGRLGGEGAGAALVMGFSGEPGSEQIFPGFPVACRTLGSLEAWTWARRDAAVASSSP